MHPSEHYEDPNPRAMPPAPAPPSHTAADYPYDPRLRVEDLHGLEKLRAVKCRATAEQLYRLYFIAEQNERNPNFQRERERDEKRRREEEDRRQLQVAMAALDGKLGQEARDLAVGILVAPGGSVRKDIVAVDTFNRELRKLRGF